MGNFEDVELTWDNAPNQLNTLQAAELLNIHYNTVRAMIKTGVLPAYKIGRVYRYDKLILWRWFRTLHHISNVNSLSVESCKIDDMILRGRQLYTDIGDELNNIVDEHVRTNPEVFRREEDFDELCIALFLLERYLQRSDI